MDIDDQAKVFIDYFKKPDQENTNALRLLLNQANIVDNESKIHFLDMVYTELQTYFSSQHGWVYGSKRGSDLIKMYGEVCRYRDTYGTYVLDFGCGMFNPLGITAVFYLNGARKTLAVDLNSCLRPERSALALYDLLIACWISPGDYLFNPLHRDLFLERIPHFDLKKLRAGDLQGGISQVPCVYSVGDFREKLEMLTDERVDIVVSNAVLEHVEPMEEFAGLFYDILSEAGVMFHNIDFIDHRWYIDSSKFSKWEYLTVDSEEDPQTNKLRLSQFESIFRNNGFEILSVVKTEETPPQQILDNLAAKYKNLPATDITTTCAQVISKRVTPKDSFSG